VPYNFAVALDEFKCWNGDNSMLIRILKEFIGSKKAVALLVGLLTTAVTSYGWDVPPETIEKFVQLLIGYMVAQGIADHGKEAMRVQMKGGG
jgi:hypothetical protein